MNKKMIIQVLLNQYANKKTFSSMHNLRWDVFVNRLGWKEGLSSVNYMEMDGYDDRNATYLVERSSTEDVTAAVRLIPTSKPYMIKDCFSNFVFNGACPQSDKIFEISRFCFAGSRQNAFRPAASLAIACVEYGLINGIDYYIGLTHMSVKKLMDRVGWTPHPIGQPQLTPDKALSVVSSYAVSEEVLTKLKRKNHIETDTLYSSEDLTVSLMSAFRQNKSELHANELMDDHERKSPGPSIASV